MAVIHPENPATGLFEGFNYANIAAQSFWTATKSGAGIAELSSAQYVLGDAGNKSFRSYIPNNVYARLTHNFTAPEQALIGDELWINWSLYIPTPAVINTDVQASTQMMYISSSGAGSYLFQIINTYTSFGMSYHFYLAADGVRGNVPYDEWTNFCLRIRGIGTASCAAQLWINNELMTWAGNGGAGETLPVNWSTSPEIAQMVFGLKTGYVNGLDFYWDKLRIATTPIHADYPCGLNLWAAHAIKQTPTSVKVGITSSAPATLTFNWGTAAEGAIHPIAEVSKASGLYHEFLIEGLSEGVSYVYKAEAASTVVTGDVAETALNSFILPESNTETTALLINDVQDSSSVYTAQPMTDIEDVDLLLSVGDLSDISVAGVDSDAEETVNVAMNMNVFGKHLREKLLAFAPGNHDADTSGGAYNDIYGLTAYPPGDLVQPVKNYRNYSFDCGYAHYAVCQMGYDADFAAWLTADMRATDKPWRIILMHPILYFTVNPPASVSPETDRAQYAALFEDIGINLVLHGHGHVLNRYSSNGVLYVECPPIASSLTGSTNVGEVGHMPSYGSRPAALTTRGYTLMTVKEKSIDLLFKYHRSLNNVAAPMLIDAFSLTQRAGGAAAARAVASTRTAAAARTART
ncbi:MAG: metallophosphoesterase [Armatimonadota bacterium]|nr:metallophosphoesterase [Armatimonadota bacterium]